MNKFVVFWSFVNCYCFLGALRSVNGTVAQKTIDLNIVISMFCESSVHGDTMHTVVISITSCSHIIQRLVQPIPHPYGSQRWTVLYNIIHYCTQKSACFSVWTQHDLVHMSRNRPDGQTSSVTSSTQVRHLFTPSLSLVHHKSCRLFTPSLSLVHHTSCH